MSESVLLSYIKQSKIYNARSNQVEILAALSNPINVDLKQQLIDSLDIEYQTPEYIDPDSVEEDVIEDVDDNNSDVADEDVIDKDNTDSDVTEGDVEPSKDKPAVESEDDSEESQDIKESHDILSPSPLDEAKQVLNDNLGSDNISYVTSKPNRDDTEIWVVCNDSKDAGEVLSSVISILSEKYPNWEFNRVARTFNAIIFRDIGGKSVVE